MIVRPAVVLAMLAGAAASPTAADASPARRVWLVAPAVPAAEPAVALLRAELSASGFAVEERAVPGPPSETALAQPPAADAFATVVPDVSEGHVAATVLVYGRRGTPVRRHRVDLGAVPPLPEAEALQRLTTLSVRVAEVLKAHAASVPDAAIRVGTNAPAPAHTPARPLALFLGVGLGAGDAITDHGAAFGPVVSLSARHRRGSLARLTLVGPCLGRPLESAAGSVLVLDSLVLVELGHEAPAAGPLAASATVSAGLQHTLAHGRPALGYDGHTDSALSPAVGVGAGLVLRLPGRTALAVGARAHHLLRRPEIWIDSERVGRAPGLQISGWLGLQRRL